jgi:hypothetical protein
LDVFDADFSSKELVTQKLNAWDCYKKERRVGVSAYQTVKEPDLLPQQSGQSAFREISVLMRRHAVFIARDPILYLGQCVVFLVVNTISGVVYFKAHNNEQDQTANKMWVLNWYVGVPANLGVMAVYFLNEELKSIF